MPVHLTRPRVRTLAVVLALLLAVTVTTDLWHDESESAGGPMTPIRQDDPDAPDALWIGDSYTVGYGSAGPAAGYACLASDRLGWTCRLDAQSGTGFVNAGHHTNQAYVPLGDRLEGTADAFDPDLVVIDAGRNDRDATMPAFRHAAVSYLDRARSAFPDARFVVVLPFLLGDTGAEYGTIDRVLRNAAEQIDAAVLDTTTRGWARMVGSLATMDEIHPTAASHAAIADRFVGDLRTLGVPGDL